MVNYSLGLYKLKNSCIKNIGQTFTPDFLCLLAPLHRLLAHVNQAILGFAVGENLDRRDGLVRVFLRQQARLLDAVALVDE